MTARAQPKKKNAFLKELAKTDFQPVESGHQQTMNDAIKFHATILMLAFGCLNQSKEKLVEMWLNDDLEEANQQFVNQLISTEKWLKDIKKLVTTAEMRMMSAAAAAAQKQKAA
jgi:hypothetical protein